MDSIDKPLRHAEDHPRVQHLMEHWKLAVQTQMHFNDMIMKTRTLGISVFIGVYGAAAVTVAQYPLRFAKLPWIDDPKHISVVVMMYGLLLLVCICLLDLGYYYRLLLGVVSRGEQIETELAELGIVGISLTHVLTKAVSRNRARWTVWSMYGIPFLIGLFFLLHMMFFYTNWYRINDYSACSRCVSLIAGVG